MAKDWPAEISALPVLMLDSFASFSYQEEKEVRVWGETPIGIQPGLR